MKGFQSEGRTALLEAGEKGKPLGGCRESGDLVKALSYEKELLEKVLFSGENTCWALTRLLCLKPDAGPCPLLGSPWHRLNLVSFPLRLPLAS